MSVEGRQLGRRGRDAVGRLVEAAAEVFGTTGFHNATVDDIVERANMARTTFYEYFDSKEQLFQATLAPFAAAIRDHAVTLESLRADAATRAGWDLWVRGFVDLYAENATLVRAWTEAEVVGTDLGILGEEALGAMTAQIATALRASDADVVDAEIAALCLVAMIERLNYYAVVGLLDGVVDRSQLAATLSDVGYAALFGRVR